MTPGMRGWLCGLALLASALAAHAASETVIQFSLPVAATTSAGIYGDDGRLVRTLWRGLPLPAGPQSLVWNGLDDSGRSVAPARYTVRLLHHRVKHIWEGVIGNSSSAEGGTRVHKAYLPPASLVIEGDQAIYAVGYNEQQPGLHGFRLAAPQLNTRPLPSTDTFAAYGMIATDGRRLYWTNTGGMSTTTFVGALDLANGERHTFSAGRAICLHHHVKTRECYRAHAYDSVIDVQTDPTQLPTGIAVQRAGRVLAVAHGAAGLVRLFDKTTGEALGSISVDLAPQALNQLAMSPDGDLWVISGEQVLRYTGLPAQPRVLRAVGPIARALAIATPVNDDVLWVADGGASQQLRRFDATGTPGAVIGRPGGQGTDPAVTADRLCFRGRTGREQTGLAISDAGDVWVADTCNNRMLRFRHGESTSDAQVAYLPAVYASTADHRNTSRVFANFLEFEVDADAPLGRGRPWRLVRNWLAGLSWLPASRQTVNWGFGGLVSVETLGNGRTYGVVRADDRFHLVELPASGPLRFIRTLNAPIAGQTGLVMYENGDLGHSLSNSTLQTVLRYPLSGFDAIGNPTWAEQPTVIATVPKREGTPWNRGAFSGALPPRFPLTASGIVVFHDQAVVGNEGFHLGGVKRDARDWHWLASPTGPLDGRGAFQTKAVDQSVHYGGNLVWTHGRHIVYGYHGEFFKDLQTGVVGQANQFMHFDDSGLFIGQFGHPSTRPGMPSQPGLSGNAFSPTLVAHGPLLYLYHNDESSHGGIHRWRFDGIAEIQELSGTGLPGSRITLR